MQTKIRRPSAPTIIWFILAGIVFATGISIIITHQVAGAQGKPRVAVSIAGQPVALNSSITIPEGDSETTTRSIEITAGTYTGDEIAINLVARKTEVRGKGALRDFTNQRVNDVGLPYTDDRFIQIIGDDRPEQDEKITLTVWDGNGGLLHRSYVIIQDDDGPAPTPTQQPIVAGAGSASRPADPSGCPWGWVCQRVLSVAIDYTRDADKDAAESLAESMPRTLYPDGDGQAIARAFKSDSPIPGASANAVARVTVTNDAGKTCVVAEGTPDANSPGDFVWRMTEARGIAESDQGVDGHTAIVNQSKLRQYIIYGCIND